MDPRYQQPPQSQYPLPQQPQYLPQAPPNKTRPSGRERSKSGFSFRSESSGNTHKRKESLQETATEKRKNHMSATTKANPNAAINEAEPIARALEKTTISGLQGITVQDINGNTISDPDRSNPTRWRMERPLDTIKSFEIAIDRAFAQRHGSTLPPGPAGAQSQRSSSYWGNGNNTNGDQSGRLSNYSGNGNYGASREELTTNEYGTPPMRYGQRPQGDQIRPHAQPGYLYPINNTRSKDTINTGNSSNSEQWNASTNPTSEEGSMDRPNGLIKSMTGQSGQQYPSQGNYPEVYGNNYPNDENMYNPNGGYPPRQASANPAQIPYGANGGYQMNQQGPPRPPAKEYRPQPPSKNMISLRQTQTSMPTGAVQPVQVQQERTSWFKKRFSRQGK